MKPIPNSIAAQAGELAEWRQDFHRHPELGYQEQRTAAKVAERLDAFGLDGVETGIGGTGVIGVLHGRGGPAGFKNGKPTVGREILALTKEGMSIKIESCVGTGPFTIVVEGKFKRKQGPAVDLTARAEKSGERPVSLVEKSGGVLKAPAKELQKLKRFVGTWKIAGSVAQAPGAERMKITATETSRFTHDGHILSVHMKGDPDPKTGFKYEAYGYMAWNEHLNQFDIFHANNAGRAGVFEAHFINDDKFIGTSSGLQGGQPTAGRMHWKFNKDGSRKVSSDTFIGAGKAACVFEGTYTRVK